MKKILLILLLTIFFIPKVNAEELLLNATNNNLEKYHYNVVGSQTFEEAYNTYLDIYKNSDYKYYVIYYMDSSEMQSTSMRLLLFNEHIYTLSVETERIDISIDSDTLIHYQYTYATNNIFSSLGGNVTFSFYKLNTISLIDTNFDFFLKSADYEIKDFYTDSIHLKNGSRLPTYIELKKYNSWSEYKEVYSDYTEVNLDNYEYLILNLKDYTKKDAFDINLKVKGMVGITPVYEFGTAEKEAVTDRCNVSYDDYTDYRFYVLKNDLLNNAVYYVKACEEGSSIKFDNTVFNVTYVTTETVNDPVITVGGVQYNVIPFDKLSNTANKNEEENFVPGESGSSLTDIIDNTTNYISSFWNSLSTFMGLVTKFFNTLPIEIRAICITTFVTACTLGLLKILKS